MASPHRDRQDRAVEDAVAQFSRLTEVVRNEDRLAVAWHQRVDGPEEHRAATMAVRIARGSPLAKSPSPLAIPS
jgi:hypothetical protein